MRRSTCFFISIALFGMLQACQSNRKAANYNDKQADDNSVNFIKNGEESSIASVKASGLAIANSKNQKVIQFAKLMIDDHTMLADDFKKLRIDNSIADSIAITPIHEQLIKDLDVKKAKVFDKAYIQMVIDDHADQIALYKTVIENKKNVEVVDFAKKMLPGLQAHLDTAKLISTTLK